MKRITPISEYDFLSSSPDASLITPIKHSPIGKLMQPSLRNLIEIDDGKEVNNGIHRFNFVF